MPDLVDKAGGPIEVERLVPPEAEPDQLVETDEVVHVGVADEYMRNFADVSGGKRRDISEIEHDGSALKEKRYKQTGIFEDSVYQTGMKDGTHQMGRYFFTCT